MRRKKIERPSQYSFWIFLFATHRIHAVATHNTEEFIYDHIDCQLQALGIGNACARNLVDAIMDYVELGYGRSTDKELGWFHL